MLLLETNHKKMPGVGVFSIQDHLDNELDDDDLWVEFQPVTQANMAALGDLVTPLGESLDTNGITQLMDTLILPGREMFELEGLSRRQLFVKRTFSKATRWTKRKFEAGVGWIGDQACSAFDKIGDAIEDALDWLVNALTNKLLAPLVDFGCTVVQDFVLESLQKIGEICLVPEGADEACPAGSVFAMREIEPLGITRNGEKVLTVSAGVTFNACMQIVSTEIDCSALSDFISNTVAEWLNNKIVDPILDFVDDVARRVKGWIGCKRRLAEVDTTRTVLHEIAVTALHNVSGEGHRRLHEAHKNPTLHSSLMTDALHRGEQIIQAKLADAAVARFKDVGRRRMAAELQPASPVAASTMALSEMRRLEQDDCQTCKSFQIQSPITHAFLNGIYTKSEETWNSQPVFKTASNSLTYYLYKCDYGWCVADKEGYEKKTNEPYLRKAGSLCPGTSFDALYENVGDEQGRQDMYFDGALCWHLAPVGSNECDYGVKASEDECVAAVTALAKQALTVPQKGLQTGGGKCGNTGWGKVPLGCSAQDNSYTPHYKGSGQSCGHRMGYRLVCSGPGVELSGGNDNDGYPTDLAACTGECDDDDQCAAGLKCFQRNNGETIPGCTGPGGGKDWDYCYDPDPAVTPEVCASATYDVVGGYRPNAATMRCLDGSGIKSALEIGEIVTKFTLEASVAIKAEAAFAMEEHRQIDLIEHLTGKKVRFSQTQQVPVVPLLLAFGITPTFEMGLPLEMRASFQGQAVVEGRVGYHRSWTITMDGSGSSVAERPEAGDGVTLTAEGTVSASLSVSMGAYIYINLRLEAYIAVVVIVSGEAGVRWEAKVGADLALCGASTTSGLTGLCENLNTQLTPYIEYKPDQVALPQPQGASIYAQIGVWVYVPYPQVSVSIGITFPGSESLAACLGVPTGIDWSSNFGSPDDQIGDAHPFGNFIIRRAIATTLAFTSGKAEQSMGPEFECGDACLGEYVIYSAPFNPSPSEVLSTCGAANSPGTAIASLEVSVWLHGICWGRRRVTTHSHPVGPGGRPIQDTATTGFRLAAR